MRSVTFLLLSLALILSSVASDAQETEVIQSEIDSLKRVKDDLDGQSNQIGIEISRLTNKKLAMEKETQLEKGVPLRCRLQTNVYAGRGTWTDKIGTIPKGTTIMAYDFKSNYYLVAFDTLNGYVMGMDVETLEVHNQKIEKQRKELLNHQRQVQEIGQQDAARRKVLVSKYGAADGDRVFKRKIWLGMTKEMAEDSWGKPQQMNRTVGTWGVREQWVYSDAYLYFHNGVLNSWQD